MTDPTTEPTPEVPPAEEPVAETPPAETTTVEEPVAELGPTDAELRAWATEHNVEGVPVAGKLSAQWREDLLAMMAAAEAPPSEELAATTETTPEEPAAEDVVEEEHFPIEPPTSYHDPEVVAQAKATWVEGQYITTGF